VIDIICFSDVSCVWAHVSQAGVDTVKEKFGDAVRIECRFRPLSAMPPAPK
jgi:predicted DsbA family dithiol-disulfide isomerase